LIYWRSGPESNRHTRICSPLHHHSATGPRVAGQAGKTEGIRRLRPRKSYSTVVLVYPNCPQRSGTTVPELSWFHSTGRAKHYRDGGWLPVRCLSSVAACRSSCSAKRRRSCARSASCIIPAAHRRLAARSLRPTTVSVAFGRACHCFSDMCPIG
jgi:hypothetical protein